MDKSEYKLRAEEIKDLISRGEYAQAAEIADTIDWRRVKSVMMLCTISDLYKINRRYEDARDMLLLAYERRPGGRTICYSLCELSIKMEEYVQAIEYYKEFVQVAPKDPGRYILQYKLYEAQDVSLEERIAVLEELKKRDYREKWAYELAYLYHRHRSSRKNTIIGSTRPEAISRRRTLCRITSIAGMKVMSKVTPRAEAMIKSRVMHRTAVMTRVRVMRRTAAMTRARVMHRTVAMIRIRVMHRIAAMIRTRATYRIPVMIR